MSDDDRSIFSKERKKTNMNMYAKVKKIYNLNIFKKKNKIVIIKDNRKLKLKN
jgi:hypothetical protein